MSKTFRFYEPTQSFLLPPSPLDWLPEGHLARFILDTVGELDLSAILGHYDREMRGFPPHHPRMMVALLLYGYCVGVASSRKIEKRTHEDVAFRVIAGNTHPDHTRISEFRRVHLAELSGLFVQVLRLCQEMGMVKLFPPQSAEAPVARLRGGNGEGDGTEPELYAGDTCRSTGRR